MSATLWLTTRLLLCTGLVLGIATLSNADGALPEAVPAVELETSSCCQPLTLPLPAVEAAAARILAESQNGTLLFSRGDCLAIRAYTRSNYTHVATLVFSDGEAWVYDSMNGPGVRKLRLADYLTAQSPDEVWLFHPARPFTIEESVEFQCALEAQLGRPYAVMHHLTGVPHEGVHCSEYLTGALIEIDWLRADNPALVSPASLLRGIQQEQVYVTGSTLRVARMATATKPSASWCGRTWQATKSCTSRSCRQLSRWILCR